MPALGGQDLEIVAVIGGLLIAQHSGRVTVAFSPGVGHERTQRTQWFAGLRGPIETVAFAGGAVEILGVGRHAIAQFVRAGVFPLRFHVGATYIDGAQFILSNPAMEDFLPPRRGVEKPLSAPAGEWNGKRPGVRADLECEAAIGVGHHLDFGLETLRELVEVPGGLDGVGRHQLVSFRSKDGVQGVGVVAGGGGAQGVDGSVG